MNEPLMKPYEVDIDWNGYVDDIALFARGKYEEALVKSFNEVLMF